MNVYERLCILTYATVTLASLGIAQVVPVSQREACDKFASAIVSIDAGRVSLGTGFLVSWDGSCLQRHTSSVTEIHIILQLRSSYRVADV